MATELRFKMSISLQEASRYYEGRAQSVKVLAENGQTIRFPAQHIRPFIISKECMVILVLVLMITINY